MAGLRNPTSPANSPEELYVLAPLPHGLQVYKLSHHTSGRTLAPLLGGKTGHILSYTLETYKFCMVLKILTIPNTLV